MVSGLTRQSFNVLIRKLSDIDIILHDVPVQKMIVPFKLFTYNSSSQTFIHLDDWISLRYCDLCLL